MHKKHVGILVLVVCLAVSSFLPCAAQAGEQVFTTVDAVLQANPLKATDKVQLINVVQEPSATVNVLRLVPGAEVKQHIHKTHDEMLSVAQGAGQLYVNGAWADVKPGVVHFNPMGKVHALKNSGKEPLVILAAYSPSMTAPDREFVEQK